MSTEKTLTEEQKEFFYKKKIKRQIRQGILPRYHFAKGGDKLERAGRKFKLSWRHISTLEALTKK